MFGLEAVVEQLLEQAVAVEDAVTGNRQVERGTGIKEAGRQTAEATVTESRVRFFFENDREIVAVFGECGARFVNKAQVGQVVQQSASHEELCGEVMLLTTLGVGFGRCIPRVGNLINDCC